MPRPEFHTAGRAKLAVANALTRPAVGKVLRRVLRERVSDHGLVFDTHGLADETVALLFWHIYESAEIRFAREFLVGSEVVVDLGASLGITGSHVLDVMDPSGLLISVEANPSLTEELERTLKAHARPDQRIRVVNAAIGRGVGETELSVSTATWASKVGPGGDTVAVETTTLSNLLDRHDVRTYALMCDIEGMETSLLWGDEAALERCQRAVFELHGAPEEIRRMIDRAGELGLRVAAQHGPVIACERET